MEKIKSGHVKIWPTPLPCCTNCTPFSPIKKSVKARAVSAPVWTPDLAFPHPFIGDCLWWNFILLRKLIWAALQSFSDNELKLELWQRDKTRRSEWKKSTVFTLNALPTGSFTFSPANPGGPESPLGPDLPLGPSGPSSPLGPKTPASPLKRNVGKIREKKCYLSLAVVAKHHISLSDARLYLVALDTHIAFEAGESILSLRWKQRKKKVNFSETFCFVSPSPFL